MGQAMCFVLKVHERPAAAGTHGRRWREAIQARAAERVGAEGPRPFVGRVSATLCFTLPPLAAGPHVSTSPDLAAVSRTTLEALVVAGVIGSVRQVVELRALKTRPKGAHGTVRAHHLADTEMGVVIVLEEVLP